MISNSGGTGKTGTDAYDNIAYIRQMLGELRGVAEREGADMLCYFLEMAYVEAGDILAGNRQLSVPNGQRNKAPGMPVQPSGKIKL